MSMERHIKPSLMHLTDRYVVNNSFVIIFFSLNQLLLYEG